MVKKRSNLRFALPEISLGRWKGLSPEDRELAQEISQQHVVLSDIGNESDEHVEIIDQAEVIANNREILKNIHASHPRLTINNCYDAPGQSLDSDYAFRNYITLSLLDNPVPGALVEGQKTFPTGAAFYRDYVLHKNQGYYLHDFNELTVEQHKDRLREKIENQPVFECGPGDADLTSKIFNIVGTPALYGFLEKVPDFHAMTAKKIGHLMGEKNIYGIQRDWNDEDLFKDEYLRHFRDCAREVAGGKITMLYLGGTHGNYEIATTIRFFRGLREFFGPGLTIIMDTDNTQDVSTNRGAYGDNTVGIFIKNGFYNVMQYLETRTPNARDYRFIIQTNELTPNISLPGVRNNGLSVEMGLMCLRDHSFDILPHIDNGRTKREVLTFKKGQIIPVITAQKFSVELCEAAYCYAAGYYQEEPIRAVPTGKLEHFTHVRDPWRFLRPIT